MNFSEQCEYLKSRGCTFTWEKAEPAWAFSKGHIFFQGHEIGTLEEHCSWLTQIDTSKTPNVRMCYSFPYEGLCSNKDFISKINELTHDYGRRKRGRPRY